MSLFENFSCQITMCSSRFSNFTFIFVRFQFPQELYLHALYVIHRLLSYQKRSRVRVPYPWKELWTSLISLLKFLTSNETALVKKMDVFTVALQVTVIFNLFITYGDTFLPSPSSYDELYYELVRCHTTFDALYSMALRYSTSGGEHKVRIPTKILIYYKQKELLIPSSMQEV